MLQVAIPENELFDERTSEFIHIKKQTIQMEHSLVSISKWEAKWHKPFLVKTPKTPEETVDYFRCMTLTQNVDPNVYRYLPAPIVKQINDYMADSMTATQISGQKAGGSREILTAEVIYYYMIENGIPFECQKWHINRLLMLIRVCNKANSPAKKRSKHEQMAYNRALNESRKKRFGTKG